VPEKPHDVVVKFDTYRNLQRITTISATNHIGHDHIGHRRNWPQTTSATAYTISATSKVHIGHRQLRVTIGPPIARICKMRTIVVPYELYELYDWGKVPELYGTL